LISELGCADLSVASDSPTAFSNIGGSVLTLEQCRVPMGGLEPP